MNSCLAVAAKTAVSASCRRSNVFGADFKLKIESNSMTSHAAQQCCLCSCSCYFTLILFSLAFTLGSVLLWLWTQIPMLLASF
jgi:hypothetical protein